MILPDTSVWIDHLSRPDEHMAEVLNAGEGLLHPFVIGEIALGNLRNRQRLMWFLSKAPEAKVARTDDVLTLINQRELGGSGIGYVDAHLLASCLLAGDCWLWTRDIRLKRAAEKLSVSYAAA
nr:type II toxin-antitoxin system VapC family toxin [uncultured Devosia sp.]